MSECVGNALFTQVNADFDRSWNFQRGKPRIDCRPVKMAGEKFSVCRGVAGVRPPNKNNSTGRLHANFVGFRKKSNREKRSAGAQESRLPNADECDFERLRCGTVGEHNSRKINRGPAVRKPERRKSQRLFCRWNPGRNSDALIQDRRLEGHLAHIHAALQKARRKTCLRSPGNLASCTS